MKFSKYNLFFLFVVFFVLKNSATTWTASGCPVTWSNTFPWPFWNGAVQLNAQPAAGDKLVIPAGCTVNVSGQPVTVTNSITLVVDGQLNFGNSNKLKLAAGSIVVVGSGGSFNAGNGGGNNNYIDIGTTAVWTAAVGDVTGPFTISEGCVLTSAGPPAQFNPPGCGTAALPIELTDFSAICISNGIQINWSTSSENENDYFLIESSTNGVDWKTTAKVKGNGTSNSKQKYIHIDYVKSSGIRYYKLSQVDFNQTITSFKMIDIDCMSPSKDEMILFPNPSITELNVLVNVSKPAPNCTIKFINTFGQIVFENVINLEEGTNSFTYPIDFNPGSYTIVFSSENTVIPSQKILIIKP